MAFPTTASGQISSDLPAVVRIACAAGDPTLARPLKIEALSEAILIQSGYPVGDLLTLARSMSGDVYRDAVVKLVLDQAGADGTVAKTVGRNVLAVGQAMTEGSQVSAKELGIEMTKRPVRSGTGLYDRYWFLRSPEQAEFKCIAGKPKKLVTEIVAAPVL